MPGNRDGSTGWRGPLRRLPQPTIRTIQNATQCNTMQHNAHSPLRIQSEGTPGVASRDCLKKGRSPTGSGPLGRLPPHYEVNPICPATNDAHDSKCNTMQHNAHAPLRMQSEGTPGVASRDCLKKGSSPTGSGPLGRLPPHYEVNPICPATNDSHDSKCNTMQHNAH